MQGTIREANRAAAKLLNVSEKFLVGKALINFIPNEQHRAFCTELDRLKQLELMQEWEVHLKPRDGLDFNAALSVAAVRDWEGKSVGWRWLLRDVTVRKQAEEQIQKIQLQNLQLQAAARVKSQFLTLMSHELRTPMNAIIGFSQLLLRHPHYQLAPKQSNMVERILNGGKHLLKLIDDILNFSKLEDGVLDLNLEELNIVELITTTVEELRCLTKQKNLGLENSLIYPQSPRC